MDKEKMIAAGIDYQGALDRFVGNSSLYQKYLIKFLDDTHVADAKKAFDSNDFAEMLSQVHALKGLAGTLGMVPLYEASSETVRELRENDALVLEEKMKKIESEYQKMLEAIREN